MVEFLIFLTRGKTMKEFTNLCSEWPIISIAIILTHSIHSSKLFSHKRRQSFSCAYERFRRLDTLLTEVVDE
jgi:hypothetical protein